MEVAYVFYRGMSFTEVHVIELNFTIEFEIILRRHIMKSHFFSDMYVCSISRGIKISFREEETSHKETFLNLVHVKVYLFIIFTLSFIQYLSTLPVFISFPFILCLL